MFLCASMTLSIRIGVSTDESFVSPLMRLRQVLGVSVQRPPSVFHSPLIFRAGCILHAITYAPFAGILLCRVGA